MAISIQYNNSVLLNSININVDDNQYYKYVSSELINFKKDNIYQISFKSISDVVDPFVLFVTSSGGTDAFNYDSKFGKPIYTPNCALNSYQDHTNRFTADNDGTGYICFAFKYGNYYVSDIKVTPYQGLNYSPDNAIITIPTPDAKRNENMSISIIYKSPDGLRVGDPESYLSNTGYPISETDYNPITGSNILISRDDNLLEGALFIGKSLRSGIELNGGSSAFIRSIGFEGFKSASLGTGGPGFLIWSGSILPSSGDGYTGVGMDMVLNSSNYFRFRTNPSELDIHTDMIFIGNPNINYISASNGKIEISSSNFLLSSSGDVVMSGEINAESGIIAGLYIKSASIQNSPLNAESTILFGSASYYYNATNISDRVDYIIIPGVDTLVHSSSIYTGTINTAETYYPFEGGLGAHLKVRLSGSDAYDDVDDPGYLRLYYNVDSGVPGGMGGPGGLDQQIYDVYPGSSINSNITLSQYFNSDAEYNGNVVVGIKYFENSSELNTVYHTLSPLNSVKDDWIIQEYQFNAFVPENANKFIFWLDFYVIKEDATSDYRLYNIAMDYETPFLEISPSGFFYRANANKFIKLGMGHYEIKGTDIESDTLSVSERIKIGSGSYRSGLLNINQYSPMSSSAINLSYSSSNSYMWIDSNNVMNFKSGLSSQLYYYKFFGHNDEILSIYKNDASGGVKLSYGGNISNVWLNADGVTNLSTSGSDNIHYNFATNATTLVSIYDNPTTGSGIILYAGNAYSRITMDPSRYTNYYTIGSVDYIHRFYKDDVEILSLRDKTDTGSLLDMYGSIAIQGHHVSSISLDGTFATPTHHKLVTEQAIKTYVDDKFALVATLGSETGGGGVSDYITKWADATTLSAANIYQKPGTNYIGVNTTDPKAMIHANGDISASNFSTSGNVNAVNGTFSGTVMANSITETSDERLKFNIRPLENQLDTVELLSPKRFNFIKNPDEEEIGLIAQEVQKIYPEFVNEINGVYSIEYSKLTTVLIQALKEMRYENIELENKFENKFENLENRLNELTKYVKNI